MLSKQEAVDAVRQAHVKTGVTWAQLPEAVRKPPAWTTAALLGQHPMGEDEAAAATTLQNVPEDPDGSCASTALVDAARKPSGRVQSRGGGV